MCGQQQWRKSRKTASPETPCSHKGLRHTVENIDQGQQPQKWTQRSRICHLITSCFVLLILARMVNSPLLMVGNLCRRGYISIRRMCKAVMSAALCVCAYTSFYPHLVPTLSLMQQPSALFIPVAVQPLLSSRESAHLATQGPFFINVSLSISL